MTTKLPDTSRFAIVAATVALLIAILIVSKHPQADVMLAIAAIIISGFLADAFTGLAHFSFDYVIPYSMPVLGPIAAEFNEHHEAPDLDPAAYLANLTKGAYASLRVTLVALMVRLTAPDTGGFFLIEATLLGMAVWALFFHQIHSYAHMGSSLPPEVLNAELASIARLPSTAERRCRLRRLFEHVPIPWPVRLMQRLGFLLSPERHNLHHLNFERDFSSVNGWSDPLLNLVLAPMARRYKERGKIERHRRDLPC